MIDPRSTTTCPRHPKVETKLTCASCGTPICPDCLVQTPVGMKCRGCVRSRGSDLTALTPGRMALTALVSLAAGMVVGWAAEFNIGFLSIFLAFAYGTFAGEMILRAAKRRGGVRIEATAGLAMLAGALGGRLAIAAIMLAAPGAVHPPLGLLDAIVRLAVPSPIPLIALVVAIVGAVNRIRYV